MNANDALEEAEAVDRGWHLDKRVPIALIAVIVAQTVGTVWWASGLNTRVAQLEQQYLQLAPQGGQIIRLQTQLEAIAANISDIKSALMRSELRAIPPAKN